MQLWKKAQRDAPSRPEVASDEWQVPEDFKALGTRAKWFSRQSNPRDILPKQDCDLEALKTKLVHGPTFRPRVNRRKIAHQKQLLEFQFNGKPEICLLNALAISYLRRNTPRADKARHIFLRIWREHGDFVAKNLNTRWIISSLQTFSDYGENEQQRQIGVAAYIYGTFVRASEVEHVYYNRKPDEVYPSDMTRMDERLRGLNGYRIGGTDMLFNLNAVMVGLAARDPVAGVGLFELLRRVRDGDTLFSRMDQTRIAKDIHIPPFKNAWSFGDDPRLR